MRTRKTRRKGGNRTSEFYPFRGFRYTNPTSSTLNLKLYSRQVGGNCKDNHERLCKKSCKKLCHYVENLPKNEFVNDMKYKIGVLQTTVDELKTEHKRLSDLAKAKYELGRPPVYAPIYGGWFFNTSENKHCIDSCSKICVKSSKETCDKLIEVVHPTPENLKYNFLVEQEKRLKSEISAMKYNQGIRT